MGSTSCSCTTLSRGILLGSFDVSSLEMCHMEGCWLVKRHVLRMPRSQRCHRGYTCIEIKIYYDGSSLWLI